MNEIQRCEADTRSTGGGRRGAVPFNYLPVKGLVTVDEPLRLSLWRGRKHVAKALEHVEIASVQDVADFWRRTRRVTDRKDAVEYYSRGHYPTRREDSQRVGALAAILDVDDTGTPFTEAHRRLMAAGVPHAMHRSFSDGLPGKGHRYRIFVPWVAEREEARRHLVKEVFRIIDAMPGSDSWSTSGLYVPTVREDDDSEWKVLVYEEGDWKPSKPPRDSRRPRRREVKAASGDHGAEEVRSLLKYAAERGWLDDEPGWCEVAQMMACWSHPDAWCILDEVSAECAGYDHDENREKFERYERRAAGRRRENLRTLASLFRRAREEGWRPPRGRSHAIDDFRESLTSRGAPDFVLSNGRPVAGNLHNMASALDALGVEFVHDAFADRLLIRRGEAPPKPLEDNAMIELRFEVDEAFGFRPPKGDFTDYLVNLAVKNPFHPVRDYLDNLTWDGVERIGTWLVDYGGAEDTPYARAVGELFLIAAVRRIRKPGVKFDEMLVLESPQGAEKSSALEALCPDKSWFSDDLPVGADSKEVIERTAGKWILEAAETVGMRKGDVDKIKAFLSRSVDGPARPAYGRLPVERPRHFVVVGTTNESQYLKDQTGNRRFWPVKVGRFDLDRLRAHRDQLWAEAAAREEAGESIRLDPKLWAAAGVQQEARRIADPWEEALEEKLGAASDAEGRLDGKILAEDVWEMVGKSDPGSRGQHDNERLGKAIRRLGFEKRRLKLDGVNRGFYVRFPSGEKDPSQLNHLVCDGEGVCRKRGGLRIERGSRARRRRREDG
jgi:hypothetical protein